MERSLLDPLKVIRLGSRVDIRGQPLLLDGLDQFACFKSYGTPKTTAYHNCYSLERR